VWDLGWDPASAVETVAALNETHATPIVALIASPVVAGELRAAGARALLSRESDGARLAAAAVAVTHGLLVIDESVGADAAPLPTPMASDDLVEPLSTRELDVLRQIAEGLSNKEIARALDISEHTVKFHVNAILGKLGAQSRTEAVVRATRAGLILL
ncbi:MAG: response regulator transcription factor, partial [Caldilineaceae bacterium]|nr:response regulator transcription factor [Caldilineaceae bacterium]